MYYFLLNGNNIIGYGECYCESDGYTCVEVSQEDYMKVLEKDTGYYIYQDGELLENPEYAEQQRQKERERINNLTLTRGDVFAGLIQARMIDEAALKMIVDQMPEDTQEQKMTKMLSLNALANALNFHRNHPMVSTIGSQLGVSEENLDLFFETNDYHYLLPESPSGRDGDM